jgi:hypothetical protein
MEFLYAIMPFHSWKDALLRRHIENCPDCGKRLASREEARQLLVQAGDIDDLDGLWPAISEKIRAFRPSLAPDAGIAQHAAAPMKAGWRWAAAAAGLLTAAFLTVWLVRYFEPHTLQGGRGMAAEELEQVQIHYVRINNEPAQTFIFKPHDSQVVIIWAGKNI